MGVSFDEETYDVTSIKWRNRGAKQRQREDGAKKKSGNNGASYIWANYSKVNR
jgi:hypothetical protein